MKFRNLLLLTGISSTVLFSCTKLDETFKDSLSAVEEGNIDPQSILQGAYNALNNPFQDQSRFWAAQQHTSDETIGPTRGGDWDDNGVWRVLHSHKWDADHGFLRDTYRELLQAQYTATNVLEISSSTTAQKGEARFIRALTMFAVLDGWDQVPYREGETFQDVTILPETKKGAECADFIISELDKAIAELPANNPVTKANRNAAKALKMKLLLNKPVYANRANPDFSTATAQADLNTVITLANEIEASGYQLQDNYFENFAPNNSAISKELIYALENTPGVRGGNVRSRWFLGLHYNQNPSGWNGFTTLGSFYDKFTDADKRKTYEYPGIFSKGGVKNGFLFGQQFDQNGVALKDRNGAPLSFTREVKLTETDPNTLEVTGIRVMKYPIDYVSGDQSDNEYVIFRLADVILMKAEALLRTGKAGDAATEVSKIRTKRGLAAITTITEDQLLDERGRELYWEGWRRNDLIRFKKFLTAWEEKPAGTDTKVLIFPIPNEQLAVNPNLTQNPGY
ncbi:RagB/SusD family nutrient uptake outer membrane protein [Flavihumibacter rivuli]|uniref:RagB/SusD family nutrient uptake outer membrane protein n=1 Tax=Flavihumibacter rivuli TaxID=2838156 RepID=UPI001BDEADF7|nr:RagB/SusD family nutrient uptake outer membrane protein [Flavihumibacter rivuli]ULQ56397.1 RagB/SusD family nutrient uptake outer membrane protein [Flavihumibacter rivuli]